MKKYNTMNLKTAASKEYPAYELLENEGHVGIITWVGDKRITHKWDKGPGFDIAEFTVTEINPFIASLSPISAVPVDNMSIQ